MKITQITYSRLVSGPGYSNTTIGATANLEPEDSPEYALQQLENWVDKEFNEREQARQRVYDEEQQVYRINRDIDTLDAKLNQARERWETVKVVSAKLGIDLTQRLGSEIDLDDVPF